MNTDVFSVWDWLMLVLTGIGCVIVLLIPIVQIVTGVVRFIRKQKGKHRP